MDEQGNVSESVSDEQVAQQAAERILGDIDQWLEAVVEQGSLSTGQYTAKHGVRIQVQKANLYLLQRAAEQLPEPKVPTYWDTDREQDVENPADPDYQAALVKYNQDLQVLTADIYMSRCEILDPGTLIHPDDDDWIEDVESMFRIDVPRKGMARTVAWLRYYALDNDDQSALLTLIIMYNNGIKEEHVQQRVDSFRGDKAGDSDNGVHDTPNGTTRDIVPVPDTSGSPVGTRTRAKRRS